MPFTPQPAIPIKDKITVTYLVERLKERVHINLVACAAGDCGDYRFVTEAELTRPGLALAGYLKLFTYQRVQVIGNTETQYLENLSKEEQVKAFKKLLTYQIPVILLTDGNTFPDYLLEIAEEVGIPIYSTPYETSRMPSSA